MFKRLLLIAGIFGITAPACFAVDPVTTGKETHMTLAIIDTTMGRIVCELYDKEAPKTVANFTGLANGTKEFTDPKTGQKTKKKFYDGLIFHRVIPEFMIQGGDPLGTGIGGPGYRFEDEISPALKFDRPGRLAMANAGPNTNGSQFFITEIATPWLDGHYNIFGQVLEGQDVVNRIARVERRERDKPVKDVVIKKVTIQKNEAAAPKTGTAAGKKVAFIIAPNNFRDEEYAEPGKILQAAGATVVTASLATGELTGMKGGKVTADLLITAVKADEYDAVAFIGGSGAQVLFGNPEAQRIAAEFAARGKPVAAICIAPTILAKAGVLKGRKATAFPSEKAELTADGAEFTGATVEQDGNIITASGPEAAKEFGDTLVKALTK